MSCAPGNIYTSDSPKYGTDSSNITGYWTATHPMRLYVHHPSMHDHKFRACLFIKPSNITGYWTVCHKIIGNATVVL